MRTNGTSDDQHRPTSHKPVRWRATAAVLAAASTAALGLATLPAFAASAAPAAATLTGGPTVHEQQALSQSFPIAANNIHTTVATSPVLAARNYLVNLVIGVDNIPPGANVLCGDSTTTNSDVVTGNYGEINNEGTATSSGNCVVTSTITINNPSDHVTAWATVYSGPGGATIGDFSMNELPVGALVITH